MVRDSLAGNDRYSSSSALRAWTTARKTWRPRSRWRRLAADGRDHAYRLHAACERTLIVYDPQVNAEKDDAAAAASGRAKRSREAGSADATSTCRFDNIQAGARQTRQVQHQRAGYLLVEIPDYGIPRGTDRDVLPAAARRADADPDASGAQPDAAGGPDAMVNWLRGGVLIQVTAGSVTGHNGQDAPSAWRISCWRSAGSTFSRPTRTTRPRGHRGCGRRMSWWQRSMAPDYAHLLCVDEPAAPLSGQAV